MSSDRIVAAAQVLLSGVYLTGYFWTLGRFIDGDIATPKEWESALNNIIGALTAGVGLILAFWFSRSRPSN